jgi:hypothetical protein
MPTLEMVFDQSVAPTSCICPSRLFNDDSAFLPTYNAVADIGLHLPTPAPQASRYRTYTLVAPPADGHYYVVTVQMEPEASGDSNWTNQLQFGQRHGNQGGQQHIGLRTRLTVDSQPLKDRQ